MADKKPKQAAKSSPKVKVNQTQRLSDWRAKELPELLKDLSTARADLRAAQKSLAADELANPKVVNKMRREIARLMTIVAEKSKRDKDIKPKTEEK
jgi:ribosomal protein L29